MGIYCVPSTGWELRTQERRDGHLPAIEDLTLWEGRADNQIRNSSACERPYQSAVCGKSMGGVKGLVPEGLTFKFSEEGRAESHSCKERAHGSRPGRWGQDSGSSAEEPVM